MNDLATEFLLILLIVPTANRTFRCDHGNSWGYANATFIVGKG